MPVILISVIVSHLQSAVVCSHWVRRNGTSRVPYNKIASPERDKPRSLQKEASPERAVHVPNKNIASPERDKPRSLQKEASPERDKPRSLQKHGFTGTGQAAFPTEIWLRRNGTSRVPYNKIASPKRAVHVPNKNMASPERDKPCSLQQHRFAGTRGAGSLQKNYPCRVVEAERAGFEPAIPLGILAFQASALGQLCDLSA